MLYCKRRRDGKAAHEKISFPFFVFNSLKGGNTYDGSVSEYGGFIVLPQSGIGAKGIRNRRLFAHKRKRHLNNNIRIEEIIAAETKRLSELFGKTFLDCEDLIRLTGLGRDNVRLLMRSRRFPVVKVGKRQVVSILSFCNMADTRKLRRATTMHTKKTTSKRANSEGTVYKNKKGLWIAQATIGYDENGQTDT